jgi:hypothetical protein
MKSRLTKFRISSTFDAERPSSSSKQRGLADSEDTRRFEETLQNLDRALRTPPSAAEAQPELHSAIMEAVRASRGANRESAANRPWWVRLRWLPAPALAALALLGLWWALHPLPEAPVHWTGTDYASILQIASALEAGDNATRTLPSAVIAPLSDELVRVNLDLENTAQFLLTSLP